MPDPAHPYDGVPPGQWAAVTKKIIKDHPLGTDEIVSSVLAAWKDLHASVLGRKLRIGKDIFPNPQIIGFLLHELIPAELADKHPGKWRREKTKAEKDLVYIPDAKYSVEIKTSSHKTSIFGNRSYAQLSASGRLSNKARSGYFLTVNFQAAKTADEEGKITRIRFGWLDPTDWIGQTAQTGQQLRLTTDADRKKLVQLYPVIAKAKAG
jgi:hypothetical protein